MKTREEFVSLLENAGDVTAQVSQWLADQGYSVSVMSYIVTPDEESRWDNTDDGDIEIRQRIEVKHRPDIDFRSVKSFPYQDVIIDEAYKVDKKKELTLLCYIVVNASRTGCFIIPEWTRKLWTRKTLTDRRENRVVDCYMIDKRHLTYYSMER